MSFTGSTSSRRSVGRAWSVWAAAIVTAAFLLTAGCSDREPSETLEQAADDTTAEHALKHTSAIYRCPMHPEIVRDEPGECPICGMDLVEVEVEDPVAEHGRESASPAAGDAKPIYYRHPHDPARTSPVPAKDEMGMDYVPVYAQDTGTELRISPAVVNNLGVRSTTALRGPLERRAETVGYVSYDDRKIQQVRPRAEGWIEGLEVRTVGESVKAGQLLFRLYSPMLESAQQEYLDALAIGNADLIDASRDRLRALGLDSATADRLARGGRAGGRVPFHSPIAGVVTQLDIEEGSMVSPEMVVMTITQLDSLWVIAEVPEAESGWVGEGVRAEIQLPSLPGRRILGQVEYVYPDLNPDTRSVRARITLDEPPSAVRPNMLATVSLLGEAGAPVVHVPRSAVIRSGLEERVIVALGDGRFAPRHVVAGEESGDRIAILEGLAEGEEVVVAGQFLLDSEANLRTALERLAPGGAAQDPAPGTGGDSAEADGQDDGHQHH
jgi:Cu(I)/Ag(I) efflux system membrane fusion protein